MSWSESDSCYTRGGLLSLNFRLWATALSISFHRAEDILTQLST